MRGVCSDHIERKGLILSDGEEETPMVGLLATMRRSWVAALSEDTVSDGCIEGTLWKAAQLEFDVGPRTSGSSLVTMLSPMHRGSDDAGANEKGDDEGEG
jgi:hypothetical protein